jgi:2,3-bisphosphoglycerate-dependent phosphoglycerate mutase
MRLFQYLLITLFASALVSCENEKEQTTIYLLRHAEKDTTVDQYNPPLIAEGIKRAKNLLGELEGKEIKYIYSTKYDRTINTVKPLSKATNKDIHIYEYHKWQTMLDSLKAIPGNHLICGHSDNLLPMIAYLGASVGKNKLGHQEYDNLFKVIMGEDSVSGEVIKF